MQAGGFLLTLTCRRGGEEGLNQGKEECWHGTLFTS